LKNLKEKLSTKYYNITNGIKNLWKWLPIVWGDRDWDHYYLYKLLNFKFKNMEYLHKNYSHLKDGDIIANQLKVVKLLTQRLIEDNYIEEIWNNHDKKWGEIKFNYESTPAYKNCVEVFLKRENIKTEEDVKQERKEFRRVTDQEIMLRKQDREYLFKLMNRNIEGWWD